MIVIKEEEKDDRYLLGRMVTSGFNGCGLTGQIAKSDIKSKVSFADLSV
ncbi:hypothetical protein ACEQPO_05145 [Bacillus sp. SL00103]